MESQVDEVSFEKGTGYHEIRNGENFTDFGTLVATEEALYGVKGAADIDDFQGHYEEDIVKPVGGSRLENGWATGNAKDPEKINYILEELGNEKRVNPEGDVYEVGWRTDLPEGYLEQDLDESDTSGRNLTVERAIENYEEGL